MFILIVFHSVHHNVPNAQLIRSRMDYLYFVDVSQIFLGAVRVAIRLTGRLPSCGHFREQTTFIIVIAETEKDLFLQKTTTAFCGPFGTLAFG